MIDYDEVRDLHDSIQKAIKELLKDQGKIPYTGDITWPTPIHVPDTDIIKYRAEVQTNWEGGVRYTCNRDGEEI